MKDTIFILLIIAIFAFTGCEERDDFSKISKDYPYKGDFAFPLGNTSLSLENYNFFLPPGWQYFYDSVPGLLPDTLPPFNEKIPFEIKSFTTDIQFISSFNFNIQTTNKFPVGANIHILLADQFLQPIDAINQMIDIEAAKSPGDSIVALNHIEVKREQVLKWENVRYMIFNCQLRNKLDSVFFENYKTYTLKIDIGIQLSLDFNLKDVKKWQ